MTTETKTFASMPIPTMFKRLGREEGYKVKPEFADGCDWVLQSTKARISLMLDGFCFRVEAPPADVWSLWKRQRLVVNNEIVTRWNKMSRDNPDHARFWQAYDKEKPYRGGVYELIGPGIKNNPHNLKQDKLVAVLPAAFAICPGYNETAIRLSASATAEQLFNQIKLELSDPQCDVEGIVIQEEEWIQTNHVVHRACRVKKKDFGIAWPTPAKVEEVKAIVPVTAVPTVMP